MKKFKSILQEHAAEGGATCLYMIACHYGRQVNRAALNLRARAVHADNQFGPISEVADHLGLSSMPAMLSFQHLRKHAPLPCIIQLQPGRFAVIYRISRRDVFLADPALGLVRSTHADFVQQWAATDSPARRDKPAAARGEVLLLEPRPAFFRLPRIQPASRPGRFRLPPPGHLLRVLRMWLQGQAPNSEDG